MYLDSFEGLSSTLWTILSYQKSLIHIQFPNYKIFSLKILPRLSSSPSKSSIEDQVIFPKSKANSIRFFIKVCESSYMGTFHPCRPTNSLLFHQIQECVLRIFTILISIIWILIYIINIFSIMHEIVTNFMNDMNYKEFLLFAF